MRKSKLKTISILIIIIVLCLSVGVYAGYSLSAKDVNYTKPDGTTNNATTVDKGMVIEDSKGNQYVWIPCTTDTSSSKLQYQRTEWTVENDNNTRASKDELTLADSTCSEDDIANGLTEKVKTAIINQVKSEKTSISKYGGYYIGRYEVGKENSTAVIKANQEPYANIIWSKAYELANGIGGGTAAETHLCSSYAWDTAINFIQNTSTPKERQIYLIWGVT